MPLTFTPTLAIESKEILGKDLKSDESAFKILFKTNFALLCSHCQIEFGLDIDSAKDIVHSGFIKLWENRQKLLDNIPVKVYLYKIISNSCVDVLRHRKVKQKHENYVLKNTSQGDYQHGLNNLEIKNLAADIDKAVAELPEQMRRVFELSRYEGLKYSEISLQLNISVKTVETQMSRALVKLRGKLSSYLTLLAILLFSTY